MAFVVQYFRHKRKVWESTRALDIPPSCREVRSNLVKHDADKAIILDDNGFELIVEERQKYDA
jgi:hypothetical protein